MLKYITKFDPTIKKTLEEMAKDNFDFTKEINKMHNKRTFLWTSFPKRNEKHLKRFCTLWANTTDKQILAWAKHSSKNKVKFKKYRIKRTGSVLGFTNIGKYYRKLQLEMIKILHDDLKRQEKEQILADKEGRAPNEEINNKPEYDPTSKLVILEMNDKNFNFTAIANEELLKQSKLWTWLPMFYHEETLRFATIWANATDRHIKEWARHAEEHGVHDNKFSLTKLRGDYNYFLEMGEEIREGRDNAIAEANKD